MEPKIGTAAPADPRAKEFLRNADPVMAHLIDVHPDFRPRAWLDELPPLDAFGTLVFQVLGQQLSVAATRAILSRLAENFGGRLPSPAELLGADAQVLRSSGMSARKAATLRAIAERFADGRLSEEVLAEMSDDEVEAALTEVPGVGPWTAHGFLLIALNRPDVFLPGDVALRRAAQRAYGFDHAPTELEMDQLAEHWRPYRSLAVAYLFTSEYDQQAQLGSARPASNNATRDALFGHPTRGRAYLTASRIAMGPEVASQMLGPSAALS